MKKGIFLEEQMGSDHTHNYFLHKTLIFNNERSERKNDQNRVFLHF
jgi:hypothetical protein